MTLLVMDTKTLQKSFGLRCKELRAGLGCSQEQFANLIEMDRSYYASLSWLGKSSISMEIASSEAVLGPIPGTVRRHR